MDNKRIEDIERLLQKMREENMQYRENKQNLYSKPAENEEEDDYNTLQSRYREPEAPKIPKKPINHQELKSEDEDSSEEEARERLKKRLDELKSRKANLGPPVRVKESKAAESDEDSEELPKKKPNIPRPGTAKVIPSYIPSPMSKKRKNDPVSLYQQRQREWKASNFLKANAMNTREGRKLNLAVSNHAKDFEISKRKEEIVRNSYTAPHEKRRDDIRFQTRVKMMSVPES